MFLTVLEKREMFLIAILVRKRVPFVDTNLRQFSEKYATVMSRDSMSDFH